MLQIIIHISNVDYSTIAEKVIPMVLETKTNTDSKLTSVLAKFKNLSGTAASAALKILPQSTKDDIAVYIVQGYNSQVINALNKFLCDTNLSLHVKEMCVTKYSDIELTLILDEIDYTSLISSAYTRVADHLVTNEKFNKIFVILDKLGDNSEKLIQATLESLSQEEKDEISSCIISTYEQEIISLINGLATEKGVHITFAGIEIRRSYH